MYICTVYEFQNITQHFPNVRYKDQFHKHIWMLHILYNVQYVWMYEFTVYIAYILHTECTMYTSVNLVEWYCYNERLNIIDIIDIAFAV